MSLERKQHADLVRHREFNALRRLMLQRNPGSKLDMDQGFSVLASKSESIQALTQIDDLEQLMSRQILGTPAQSEFSHTHIASRTSAPLPTSEQATLKEAAVLFADGHDLQVQQLFERALGDGGPQHGDAPTWLALLDFYRATNQPDRFEAYALDFSVRFGRSTPSWESIEQLAIAASTERSPMPATLTQMHIADWIAPFFLNLESLQSLQTLILAAKGKSKQFVMDWRDLVAIDPECWGAFQTVFQTLATLPLQWTVQGAATLESIFDASTPEAMLAHLAFLRCQNLEQSFEDLAMAYCTRFEVSPPDWGRSLCHFTVLGELFPGSPPSPSGMSALTLFGALDDESELLQSVTAHVPQAACTIDCRRLVRCNARAAAALKVWAQYAQQSGYTVSFQNVHRLIAPYFALQGLDQCAAVTTRPD